MNNPGRRSTRGAFVVDLLGSRERLVLLLGLHSTRGVLFTILSLLVSLASVSNMYLRFNEENMT